MKAANRKAHLAGVHDRALLAGVHDRSRPCVHDRAQVFTTVRFFGKQEDASTDTLASVPSLNYAVFHRGGDIRWVPSP